jgi:hypothetical protein
MKVEKTNQTAISITEDFNNWLIIPMAKIDTCETMFTLINQDAYGLQDAGVYTRSYIEELFHDLDISDLLNC